MRGQKKEFLSTKELAKRLGVSESTVKYWLAKYPEIKKFAKVEEKVMRVYYRWFPDAPEKIKEFLREKRGGGY